MYNRLRMIYGNSIVVAPGIKFQDSEGEMKKQKNEGQYQK